MTQGKDEEALKPTHKIPSDYFLLCFYFLQANTFRKQKGLPKMVFIRQFKLFSPERENDSTNPKMISPQYADPTI